MDKLLLLGAIIGFFLLVDGAPTDPDEVPSGAPPGQVKDRKSCMVSISFVSLFACACRGVWGACKGCCHVKALIQIAVAYSQSYLSGGTK